MIDEQTIIKNVVNGDTESFRLLVEEHQKPVIRMIGNIISDRHICEDIAQEVFFAAFKKLKTFDSAQSKFSTWLFTIARNKSLNAIKKKKVQLIDELSEVAGEKKAPDILEQ